MAMKPGMALTAAVLLYAARRYFRDWGTTKGEADGALAGDGLLAAPVLTATEGVWIDASAAQVWPWLIQMGQDRGGLYSFESFENFVGLRYHNADHIDPHWQRLAVGDVVRLVPEGWMGLAAGVCLRVVEVVETQTIVLRTEPSQVSWDGVLSLHIVAHQDDRTRLLIRSRLALRRPGQVVLAEMAGPLRAFVVRGMLIGVKRRVERAAVDHRDRQTAEQ